MYSPTTTRVCPYSVRGRAPHSSLHVKINSIVYSIPLPVSASACSIILLPCDDSVASSVHLHPTASQHQHTSFHTPHTFQKWAFSIGMCKSTLTTSPSPTSTQAFPLPPLPSRTAVAVSPPPTAPTTQSTFGMRKNPRTHCSCDKTNPHLQLIFKILPKLNHHCNLNHHHQFTHHTAQDAGTKPLLRPLRRRRRAAGGRA